MSDYRIKTFLIPGTEQVETDKAELQVNKFLEELDDREPRLELIPTQSKSVVVVVVYKKPIGGN